MTTRNKGSTENVLSKHISTMTVALTKDLSAYDNVVIVKPNDTDALYAKYKKTGTGGTASTLTDLGFNDLDGNIWQIVISTELTPMHFGAIGNGVTNDAVALNNAFKSGADIHLPPDRTFAFSGSLDVISNNISVRGRGVLKCTSATGINATGDLIKISGTDILFDNVIIEDSVNSSSVNRTINIANARFKIRDSVLVSTYKRGIESTTSTADDCVIENVEHRSSRSTCTHNIYCISTSSGLDIVGGKCDAAVYMQQNTSLMNVQLALGSNASTYLIGGSGYEVSGCDITTSSTTPIFGSALIVLCSNNVFDGPLFGTAGITLSFNGNNVRTNSGTINAGNICGNSFGLLTANAAGWSFSSPLVSSNDFIGDTSGALVTNTHPGSPLFIGNVAVAAGTITNFLSSSAGTPILVSNYKDGVLES